MAGKRRNRIAPESQGKHANCLGLEIHLTTPFKSFFCFYFRKTSEICRYLERRQTRLSPHADRKIASDDVIDFTHIYYLLSFNVDFFLFSPPQINHRCLLSEVHRDDLRQVGRHCTVKKRFPLSTSSSFRKMHLPSSCQIVFPTSIFEPPLASIERTRAKKLSKGGQDCYRHDGDTRVKYDTPYVDLSYY